MPVHTRTKGHIIPFSIRVLTADELTDRFIARIRQMNEESEILTHLDAIEADIWRCVDAAMDEAHMTYGVPRYMNRPDGEAVVRCMLAA